MINLLEHCLKKIDLSPYSRGSRNKGAELLTSTIENFSQAQGFECEKEVFLGLKRKTDGYIVTVFLLLVSLAHLLRLIFQAKVMLNNTEIPMRLSAAACIVTAVLAIWLWRENKKSA
jgi:hypothetical protein